jgi:hypothetical protein
MWSQRNLNEKLSKGNLKNLVRRQKLDGGIQTDMRGLGTIFHSIRHKVFDLCNIQFTCLFTLNSTRIIPSRQAEAYISKYQAYIVQNCQLKGYLRFKELGFTRQTEFAYDVGNTTLEMSIFVYSMVINL